MMKSRTMLLVLLGTFLVSGCAFKEYRAQKIHVEHPQWDELTVQNLAARKVEIGMTDSMVVAALGRPDAISQEGDLTKWGYATPQIHGQGDVYLKFIYFVYLKNGQVVRTEGDRTRLGYLPWYR
jgi:outer membrane protein assembly factor BamE (lipoprotein component of BamABCDE complex)